MGVTQNVYTRGLQVSRVSSYNRRKRPRKYWLIVIPDKPDYTTNGRACGRMAFAALNVTGPYEFSHWLFAPTAGTWPPGGLDSNCDSWPGDVLETANYRYFVGGWGNIYRAEKNGSLLFERLRDAAIARPPAAPAWDDRHQIEFMFLLPTPTDPHTRVYHASYSSTTHNNITKRADYGYKQAIGMYSFVVVDENESESESETEVLI